MSAPWIVRHIDLRQGCHEITGPAQPHFLIFWWGGLPLGQLPLLAGEMPLRRAQVMDILARFAAQQVADRSGDHVRAAYDGHPAQPPPLAVAVAADHLFDRLDQWADQSPRDAARLSVVICTRDRPALLSACLDSLAAQASPPGQVVVVDNAATGSAGSVSQDRPGVTYVHAPEPGLSRARNVGLRFAEGDLVAFTDDDVELTGNWTSELVAAFDDPAIQAVTGLVLPARLDTEAQAAFQIDRGGFTERFTPMVFGLDFLDLTRNVGPQVWRIGAGANMAFRKSICDRVGGFDERLGAGASGCSEDSEYWYRILAAGGSCLYEPRAVVFHHHRTEAKALRAQMRSYMQGHVAALVAQADRYGDRGNLRRLGRQLPAYFLRAALSGVKNRQFASLRLLAEEVLGWTLGLSYLLRPGWRRRSGAPSAPRLSLPITEVPNHA